jgi:hypothetical protein
MRVFAAVLLLSACQDLHEYQGAWHGTVSGDPQLAVSAPPTMSLIITSVDHTQIAGNVDGIDFTSLRHAAADAMAEARVGPDALRTYFAFLSTGPLVVISLFPDQRVEVRLIQGDTVFGLYELRR